jgi:hypothetical protein
MLCAFLRVQVLRRLRPTITATFRSMSSSRPQTKRLADDTAVVEDSEPEREAQRFSRRAHQRKKLVDAKDVLELSDSDLDDGLPCTKSQTPRLISMYFIRTNTVHASSSTNVMTCRYDSIAKVPS